MPRKAITKRTLKLEDVTSSLELLDPQNVAAEIEVSTSDVAHKCARCSTVYRSAVALKRHYAICNMQDTVMNALHDENINLEPSKYSLSCDQCSKKFKFKKSLAEHIKEAHSVLKRSVKCSRCSQRCPNKKKLKEHMETHETKVQCNDCGKTFSRAYHLVRHLKQKGCGSEQPLKPFQCKVCEASFSRKDNLLSHLRWHIGIDSNRSQCKICRKLTPSFSSLVRHYTHQHLGGKMECEQCGKQLSSRIAFIKHLAIHGEKNFSCEECDFKCKSQEILRRHALRHTARKPLACSFCPRTFIQHHELTAHLFKHTGSSSIVCHYCGECFPSKMTMKSHIARVHEGKPALYCPHKGCRMERRPFVNAISLRIHIMSHQGQKQYECRSCSKTFHLKNALLSHELTHEWQKPRRCIYCVSGRAYIRGDLLMRHVRIKHPKTFDDNLMRVRKLLGQDPRVMQKLTKEEVNAMVNLIDALHENKLESIEELSLRHITGSSCDSPKAEEMSGEDFNTVMSEEELAKNIKMMMERLIDKQTLELLGWPDTNVDDMLASVLQQCDVRVAEADKFPRVACLRENTKQLFLRVVEDSTISRMLNTRTVDEVIRHVVSASS